MKRFFLLFFIFLFSHAFSQTGSITGIITDKSTHEPIPLAAVYVDSLKNGVMSSMDGSFVIKASPGKHSLIVRYIDYKADTIPGIFVMQDTIIKIDVELEPNNKELKTVEIKAAKITHTENAVINEMKKSDNVVSGISGSQISKSQDKDASEVVKRIPGVTVIENRFIMVRGLNDRYNSVWLNDACAPSSETDKKSFSFDVIPSGLIDRILVFKTPSPELPGDFAGGMVKVYTKSFPQSSTISVNYQTSYRPGSTGSAFYYTDASKTDWLGYDNGFRDIPSGSPDYFSKHDANIDAETKAFKNTWAIHSHDANPDQRFNTYITNVFGKYNSKFGNTFGLFYANTHSTYTIHRQDWDSLTPANDYTDMQSTHTVRTGALENMSFIHKNLRIDFKNFLNQIGKDMTVQRNSNRRDDLITLPDEKSYLMSYEERTTLSSQLSGQYKSSNENFIYGMTLGYGYNTKNTPDLRRIAYAKQQYQPDSMYKVLMENTVDPVQGGGREFSWLKEKVYSFNHSLSVKINITKNYSFDVNAGNYIEYKSRNFRARTLGYTLPFPLNAQTFQMEFLPVDQIFAPQNVGTNGFKMDEITSASDAYNAQNKLIASYISLGIPIGKKIKMLGGVRYEYNVQSLQGHINLDSITPSITTKYLLPSVNFVYNITKKSLVRAAYGKTVNRPEFREWSPFYFYDFDFKVGTYGSLFPTALNNGKGALLSVAEINNYDLRLEFYPRSGEMIQLGVFYKQIKNPIQQIIFSAGGKAFTFANASSAIVQGIELDLRKNLAFADTLLGTRFLKHLSVVGNLSFIKSILDAGNIDPAFNSSMKVPMQGQSPYVINGGIYYQNDSARIQLSILYNVFGPRIYELGNSSYQNIGELARHSLDLTVSKIFWKKFTVSFGLQDILDQPVVLVYDTNRNGKFENNGSDKEIMSFRKGKYFTFGIGVKL